MHPAFPVRTKTAAIWPFANDINATSLSLERHQCRIVVVGRGAGGEAERIMSTASISSH
jgi:hypothetical protein